MASPQAQQILTMMRQVRDSLDPHPTLEQQRAGGEMFGALTAEPEGVETETVDAGGVEALWVTPAVHDAGRVVLYLHGGGYVACSMHSHRALVGHLATASRARALVLNYRLAPEHPFPAAVEDAVAGYRWLVENGTNPAQIVIAGDSAGGGLTLATLLRLRDDGDPLPAAGVTFSAYTDATCSGDSYGTKADLDMLVSKGSAEVSWNFYLSGGGDAKDPLVSPVFADFTGLPPLLMQVGADECLYDDSARVAEAAEAVGVEVTFEPFAEMQHVFQVAAGNMPEADEALAAAGRFIQSRTG